MLPHYQKCTSCTYSKPAFPESSGRRKMQQPPTNIPVDDLETELKPSTFLGRSRGFRSQMSRREMEERQRRAAERWLTPEMVEVNKQLRAKFAREQARNRRLLVLRAGGALVATVFLVSCLSAVLWNQHFAAKVCLLTAPLISHDCSCSECDSQCERSPRHTRSPHPCCWCNFRLLLDWI